MQLPQIRLNTRFAQIEIETAKAQQSIEQPRAELDIQQPKAELTIDRTPSKLSIDQTRAWEALDLKHIFRRIEEYSQNGYQDWLKGLDRRASEGEQLMKIENKGHPITTIAKQNSEKPMLNFNIGFVPPHNSVKIDYDPGKLNMEWKIKQTINNTQQQKPIIEYKPGEVTTKLRNHAQLHIDFVNLKFTGINYEQEI